MNTFRNPLVQYYNIIKDAMYAIVIEDADLFESAYDRAMVLFRDAKVEAVHSTSMGTEWNSLVRMGMFDPKDWNSAKDAFMDECDPRPAYAHLVLSGVETALVRRIHTF